MEDKLFDYDSLDGDAAGMKYWDVTLKQKIGEHEIGTKFPTATICFEKSWLSFYNENQALLGRYQLELSVTKDLLNEE